MDFADLKKYICGFLAVIIFFLGMCLDTMETDSYFAYDMVSWESEHLKSADYIAEGESSCTNEMLGRQKTIQPRITASNNTGRNFYRIILLSFIAGVVLQNLFYLKATTYYGAAVVTHSEDVAIGYIHQTDGEK